MKNPRRLGGPIRVAWFIVLGMMLAAAAWSISGKLIAWGMSPWLAWGLSLMFDLAGLICADYARRAVERNSPAGLPRVAILAFVSVSGALNWSHGRDIGGYVAAYGLASISFAVELLFELHRRDVRDEQRAERGLLAERMPHIPILGWLMYPGRSWTTLRGAVGARLDLLDPVQAERPVPTRNRAGHAAGTVRSAVRAVLSTCPDASSDEVMDHLDSLGIDYDEDTVRTLVDSPEDTSQDRQDSRSPHPLAPPGQTITDTVRTALSTGLKDKNRVLSYVQKVHGDSVDKDTVVRLINREKRKQTRAAS